MPSLPRKRRSTTLAERLTPCECCGHPITERHHFMPFKRHGDGGVTAQLCANCHDAYHIFDRAHAELKAGKHTSRNITIMIALRDYWGKESTQVLHICHLIQVTYDHTEKLHKSLLDWAIDEMMKGFPDA